MRTQNRKHEDGAVALFGVSSERGEFERSARERADEAQTAPLLITTGTVATVPITITICARC